MRLMETAVSFAQRASSKLLRADRSSKQGLAIAADIASCWVATVSAFSLRLGYWQVFSEQVWLVFAIGSAIFLPIFIASGVYANLFRFHGTRGTRQLAMACVWMLLPSTVIFGAYGITGVPRTVGVLMPLVFFIMVGLNRLVARYVLVDLFGEQRAQRKVLIYGAGSAGRQLATSISYEPSYQLCGYIDDDPVLVRSRLEGVPIFAVDQLKSVIEKQGAEIVFLALPSLSRSKRAEIVEELQKYEVHVLMLPGIEEIVDGKVSVNDLREVDVTELLSRDPVRPDERLLGAAIRGKTVLVTGAGGSIGSELARQIVRQNPTRLILLEMSEAALYLIDQEIRGELARSGNTDIEIIAELTSVEKKSAMRRIFDRYKPQTVYHAAAYKHVPMVEANVVAGVSNNVGGTLNCALAACNTGVERFILVSTDKAVRPTNVMGASKRVCELVLQALSDSGRYTTIFSIVRFGNVLGSSGSVVPLFREQIATGGPVMVTHRDITRFFMTIPEAAELVIQAGAMADGGEVYLLDMGEPVRIMDLAHTMVRLSGRSVKDANNPGGDIEIIETGLRPGEKLYEELLIDAEAGPTQHSRIFKAQESTIPWADLSAALDELHTMAKKGDVAGLRAKLQILVPEFAPNTGNGA